MGVGVGAAKANPNDTTAENTDGVKASETADKGATHTHNTYTHAHCIPEFCSCMYMFAH